MQARSGLCCALLPVLWLGIGSDPSPGLPEIWGGALAVKVRGRPRGATFNPQAAKAPPVTTKLGGERVTAWGHHQPSSLWPTGAAVKVRNRTPPWEVIVETQDTCDREADPTADRRAHVEDETRPGGQEDEDPTREHKNAIDHDRTVPSEALPRTRPGRGWHVTVSLVTWHPGAGQESKPSPRRSWGTPEFPHPGAPREGVSEGLPPGKPREASNPHAAARETISLSRGLGAE